MDLESIIKLIQTVSDSSLSSFTLEEGTMKISLTTGKGQIPEQMPGEDNHSFAAKTEEMAAEVNLQMPEADVQGQVVTSPLVGTFYASSGPQAESYVSVGDRVQKGQVLGIVEAMKLMNEIESDYDGTVKAIYVQNEQMVEYGQPMFLIG